MSWSIFVFDVKFPNVRETLIDLVVFLWIAWRKWCYNVHVRAILTTSGSVFSLILIGTKCLLCHGLETHLVTNFADYQDSLRLQRAHKLVSISLFSSCVLPSRASVPEATLTGCVTAAEPRKLLKTFSTSPKITDSCPKRRRTTFQSANI